MEVINQKTDGDRSYIAGFVGKKVGIYAATLSAAKDIAIKHFKPSKKNMGLFWIQIAEEES